MATPQFSNPWLDLTGLPNLNGFMGSQGAQVPPPGSAQKMSIEIPNTQPHTSQPSVPTLLNLQQMTPKSVQEKYTYRVPLEVSPEEKAISEELRQRQAESRQGQIEGINNLQDLLSQHIARQKSREGLAGMDLTPLMALADTWYGTKMAQSYNRPEDSKAQLETTARLQDALQRAKGNLTEGDIKALNNQLDSIYGNKKVAEQSAEAQARIGLINAQRDQTKSDKDIKLSIDANKDYNKNFGENINGIADFTASATKAINIIKQNNGEIPQVGNPLSPEYDAAVSQMLTNYNSHVAKLGALAGADLKLLTNAIGNDVGVIDKLMRQNIKGGGSSTLAVLNGILSKTDDMINRTKSRVSNVYKGYADDSFNTDYQTYKMAREGKIGVTKPNPTNKPKSIMQNGHEYKLNESTGEYE